MDLSVREAISKLVGSAMKRSLRRPAFLCPTKIARTNLSASTLKFALRNTSSSIPVTITETQAPPSSTSTKGKRVTTEGLSIEVIEAVNLPNWFSPLATAAVEFHPPHLRKHVAFVGEAQTTMMQSLFSVGALTFVVLLVLLDSNAD